MKDRKIISCLTSIDVYELNSFGKFIHSPFFNVNLFISTYFDILSEYIKENKDFNKLDNTSLWQMVYGMNQAYNNQKFLKLNSDLVKLFEDFLAQKEFDTMTSLKTNLKLEGARKREIDSLYNGIVSEIERLEKLEMNKSVDYYYNRYLIERNLFGIKADNEKKNAKFEIETELNINKISENLDHFYIAEKLRLYCTLLSWKKMYKLDMELENMDMVIAISNKEKYNQIPPIILYNKMKLTYEEESNVEHYYELRTLMKKFIHLFPTEEVKEMYSTALGYSINKINKNQSEFHRETFEVYKEGLQNDILLSKSELSVTTFRNIAIAALRVEEFNWAENFILDYSKYVEEKFRDNAVQFSLARLEFYRKNFDKVLDHLNKVDYEDVWYNLGSKTLQIASYYELDEYDALESLIQAFKMYIRREKSLTKDRKDTYLNLIKYTGALMKLTSRDKDKLRKLREDIHNTKGVVSKPWLLEKVEVMIGK